MSDIRAKFEFWHWMKFHQIFTKEEVFKRETKFTRIRDYEREDIDTSWKGFKGGYESRQPEIDALKAEVEQLKGIKPSLGDDHMIGTPLPRFGIKWSGPTEPLSVPMDDGYWTPWHYANAEIERLSAMIENVRGK